MTPRRATMPGLEGLMRTGRRLVTLLATAGLVCVALPSAAQAHPPGHDRGLQKVDHIVVIYEENHSFDNLLGGWPGVDGLARDPARTPLRDAGRSRRRPHSVELPAPARRQPDLAAAVAGLLGYDAWRHRVRQPLPQPAVPDRRVHP